MEGRTRVEVDGEMVMGVFGGMQVTGLFGEGDGRGVDWSMFSFRKTFWAVGFVGPWGCWF